MPAVRRLGSGRGGDDARVRRRERVGGRGQS